MEPPVFVALSRFTVANGMEEEVKRAFRNRPHLVDGSPGFLRMEVLSPVDVPAEIWLLTWWSDEESFRTWHHSHLYRESHAGSPGSTTAWKRRAACAPIPASTARRSSR